MIIFQFMGIVAILTTLITYIGMKFVEWFEELRQLREQTKWIPCSEQPPKESGKYLVTHGGMHLIGIDFYCTEEDAKRDFEEPEEYMGWRSGNVLAWMPLPEPYKENNYES